MHTHKILIIDDEPEVCILLANFFRGKQQETDYTMSLKDGAEKFSAMKPDILILDHNLPDGYGIEHIQKFKEVNPSTRVVIISAMSNLKDRALENGADLFLEKPISFAMLRSLIGA